MTGKNQTDEPEPSPENIQEKSGWPTRLWLWIDRRSGADELLHKSLDEPVPGGARFAYVFGSALLFIFISQVITGLCLALYYVPSPLTAHVTLAYIIKDVAGGAFLRSLHSYGSSAMIVVLVLHFLQTFLYGSYKGRRELLWMSGCVLSLLVLGMTFTGYLLRWDLKAYFSGAVGTNLLGDVPLIGGWLLRLIRGGSTMGALTLSRFYVLHLFILPAAIFLFIAIHIFMFRKAGAAGPMTEDPVHPHLPTETFYPKQVIIDMAFVLVVMGVLGMLAHFVPVELGPVADPSNSNYLPRPEWYYLPFFEWLKFWEGAKTVIGVVLIPGILVGLVFLLPFLDRNLERRPWKRPIPVASVLIVLIALIGLGMQSRLDDSRDPTTASQIAQQDLAEDHYFHTPFNAYSPPSGGAAPVALSGADAKGKTIFDSHGCSGCHGVGGVGGGIGPALNHISNKFQPVQLTALLKAPNAKMKAGGMVPLTVNAADLTALVSYLSGLGGTSASSSATPPASGSSPPTSPASALTAPSKALSPPKPAAAAAPPKTRPETPAASASAPVRNLSAQVTSGEKTYQSHGCFACHGVGGIGTPRASALTVVGKQLSAVQITALLHNPTAKMKAGGMPPVTLSDPELVSLVAYIKSLGATERTTGRHATAKPVKQPNAQPPRKPAPAASETAPSQPPKKPGPASRSRTSTSSPATPSASTSATSSPSSSDQHGEKIFNANGCAACHGAGGIGTTRAPALAKFTKTITPAALTTLLHHPTKKMTAGGMPPVNLVQTDMSALVAYLQNLGTPAAAAPLAATAPSPGAPPAAPNQVAKIPPQSPMTKLEYQGKLIFQAHRCADCHGTGGIGGTAAASALAGTGTVFPPALLTRMLQHPTPPMQKGGMPPVSLGSRDLKALVAYVSHISASKTSPR
ncbi:MAG: cytochrome b N-terminal domain-containing protein [Candidatus Acidiferrales bacterium]